MAFCVYLLHYGWSRHYKGRPAARRSGVTLGDAFRSAHDASDEQLARTCEACERLLWHNSKDHAALHAWGRALFYLAGRTSGAERDRLYAQAQEKHAKALALASNHGRYAAALSLTVADRAKLHRGKTADSLFRQAGELCERVVAENPRDVCALQSWAWVLHCQGSVAPDAVADSFLAQATDICSATLAIKPGDVFSLGTLGHVLARRARLHQGEERNQLIQRASELLENALLTRARHECDLLSTWAYILFVRNKHMPGEVTDRLLAKAEQLFEEASKDGAERVALVAGWGVLHWARAKTLQGDESRQLLQRAKDELVEDAASGSGPSAYNVACICVELGEIEECRRWLEQSQEPGGYVSRDEMSAERELENVRTFEWFQALLVKETPGGEN